MGDMQEITDKIEELHIDLPISHVQFEAFQDRVKTTFRRVNTVKNAKELIDQSLDCDLRVET